MKNTLSSRYAKAFLHAIGEEKCQILLQKMEEIEALFAQKEFCEFLNNPFVSSSKKSKMILEVLKLEDKQICNGIEVVAKAGRLGMLLGIVREISDTFATKRQTHQAVFYSKNQTSKNLLDQIGNALSTKLGANVEVIEKKWDKDGVRCVIEDLNLEISFSQGAFVSHLKEYILDTFRKGV